MTSAPKFLRFLLLLLLVALFLSVVRVGYLRVNSWPWGRLDTSGCVSSVMLHTEALDLQPGSIQVGYLSLDLASGAEVALVGLQGARAEQDEKFPRRHYAILAPFDTCTGQLIRVLCELRGNPIGDPNGSRGRGAFIAEVALSPDDWYRVLAATVADSCSSLYGCMGCS